MKQSRLDTGLLWGGYALSIQNTDLGARLYCPQELHQAPLLVELMCVRHRCSVVILMVVKEVP